MHPSIFPASHKTSHGLVDVLEQRTQPGLVALPLPPARPPPRRIHPPIHPSTLAFTFPPHLHLPVPLRQRLCQLFNLVLKATDARLVQPDGRGSIPRHVQVRAAEVAVAATAGAHTRAAAAAPRGRRATRRAAVGGGWRCVGCCPGCELGIFGVLRDCGEMLCRVAGEGLRDKGRAGMVLLSRATGPGGAGFRRFPSGGRVYWQARLVTVEAHALPLASGWALGGLWVGTCDRGPDPLPHVYAGRPHGNMAPPHSPTLPSTHAHWPDAHTA
eukprot:170242-Chlamydomonas_euryale.AAC.5